MEKEDRVKQSRRSYSASSFVNYSYFLQNY